MGTTSSSPEPDFSYHYNPNSCLTPAPASTVPPPQGSIRPSPRPPVVERPPLPPRPPRGPPHDKNHQKQPSTLSRPRQPPNNMPQSFNISLVSVDKLDSYSTREFPLALNSEFPIGRASSNAQKRHLMSAQDNGYIDSPVISREHAVLTANIYSGTPCVYITDKNSMHGTLVNDEKLEPTKARQLSSGDVLQFGQDVNRNESSFLARKYVIQTTLLPSEPESFSQGFTVPDADSSEEEDVEEVEAEEVTFVATTPSAKYGSQNNPVTIEDSEESQKVVIDLDAIEPPQIMPLPTKTEPPIQRSPSPPAAQLSPSSSQLSAYDDSDSEIAGSDSLDAMSISMCSSSDEEDEDGENEEDEDEDSDASSENGSVHSSEAECNSNPDPAAVENEEDTDGDALRRMKLEAMLNHERLKVSDEEPKPATMSLSVPPPENAPITMNSPSLQSHGQPQLLSFFSEPGISPMAMFENPFADCSFTPAPPLPPRPSAPRPTAWGPPDYVLPLTVTRENSWWTDESPTPANYLGTNFGDRPALFSPAPLPSVVDPMQPKPLTQNWAPTTPPLENEAGMQPLETVKSEFPAAAEMQSPPSMPSDPITPNPPQRRTKVTIPEIVEDHPSPPNPPTPTSVQSRKRKADVLEEHEEENAQEGVAPVPEKSAVPAVAAPVQERPKKRLRSRIGSALSTAAAYVVPGTAVAMGLFMYLPESFFTE